MFVLNFGVESLEQSAKLGRLLIFDILGNQNVCFFSFLFALN